MFDIDDVKVFVDNYKFQNYCVDQQQTASQGEPVGDQADGTQADGPPALEKILIIQQRNAQMLIDSPSNLCIFIEFCQKFVRLAVKPGTTVIIEQEEDDDAGMVTAVIIFLGVVAGMAAVHFFYQKPFFFHCSTNLYSIFCFSTSLSNFNFQFSECNSKNRRTSCFKASREKGISPALRKRIRTIREFKFHILDSWITISIYKFTIHHSVYKQNHFLS